MRFYKLYYKISKCLVYSLQFRTISAKNIPNSVIKYRQEEWEKDKNIDINAISRMLK